RPAARTGSRRAIRGVSWKGPAPRSDSLSAQPDQSFISLRLRVASAAATLPGEGRVAGRPRRIRPPLGGPLKNRRAVIGGEERVELLRGGGGRRLRIGTAKLRLLDRVGNDLVDLRRHARLGSGARMNLLREHAHHALVEGVAA